MTQIHRYCDSKIENSNIVGFNTKGVFEGGEGGIRPPPYDFYFF
jgi:hypothetical protein